jgi:ssDNA-binding Zn-finger/Zn-ribbon topoisomerase 1
MKNTIKVFLASFFIASFISCSENEESSNANKSKVDLAKKNVAIQNFRKALIKMADNRKDLVSKTGFDNTIIESESQDIIYLSAKELLLANGMDENQIAAKCNNNPKAVIGLAYTILAENNQPTNSLNQ